jgi:hypothetical protein
MPMSGRLVMGTQGAQIAEYWCLLNERFSGMPERRSFIPALGWYPAADEV